MLFSKEYVGYLAREVTKKLIAGKMIETSAVPAVNERVNAALVEELSWKRVAKRFQALAASCRRPGMVDSSVK